MIETGPDSTRFAIGDRVHGLAPLGGFAERVAVPETLLRFTADDLPLDLAATTGTTYRTAYDALISVAKVRPGEDLVILGAAGAVGAAAIGVGKALGARVITCASTAQKLAYAPGWAPLPTRDGLGSTGTSSLDQHPQQLGRRVTCATTKAGSRDCQNGWLGPIPVARNRIRPATEDGPPLIHASPLSQMR